jgi:uncharacterized protein YyaL (SSP411 family)
MHFFLIFYFPRESLCRIVTFEDVLEELLQEEIYDENDQMEKKAGKIARWVIKRWKNKKRRREMEASGKTGSMSSVVSQAIAASRSGTLGEASSLLPKDISDEKTDNGIFTIFQNLTRNFSSSD